MPARAAAGRRRERTVSLDTIIAFLKKPVCKRLFIFALLVLFVFLLRSMITLLLLTFIFIYIFSTIQNGIYSFLSRFFKVNIYIVTAAVYILFTALFVVIIRMYAPQLISQISQLVSGFSNDMTTLKGQTADSGTDPVTRVMIYVANNVDVSKYISSSGANILSFAKSVGTTGLYAFLALLLSLFFLLEKKSIREFFSRFKNSKLYWMYSDTSYILRKFANSFGKVIQNQIIISMINCGLSVIILLILGFPYLLGLGAMIFVLGLVPVAGVFISLIPLSVIAYKVGGLMEIVYILILIAVLHSIECYILNPKLMSYTAKMPVFCTFLILIISDRLMGPWGLIMGIPLMMFLLDLFDVIPDSELTSRRQQARAAEGRDG
jgi:predicted PurR-regulated permease PerM